ncbi:MAG: guanylate kinase [Planctomycetia bacterium]|nr:guanylate kinase [Planctomycetia bacterium]
MSKPGRLLILSGPSGVGKSTVRDRVMEQSPVPLKLSVSATTRAPREGEQNGVDYHFLTPEAFEELRRQDAFIECKQVYGRNVWYGTLRGEVEEELRRGRWVMLEIDVDGTADVVRQYPDAVTVFILPPSLEELEKRLRGRGTESDEAIERRLARAAYEIEKSKFYKYPIVNDVLEKTVAEFCDIILRTSGESE